MSDIALGLVTLAVGVLATWFFARLYYVKSSRDLRQGNIQLQEYITEQRDYLYKLISTLQERGELNVPLDASGNPKDVQVIAPEQIPSEAEVYTPNVSLGPPPSPPDVYYGFLTLRQLQYTIAGILIERWEEGQRRIRSEDLYEEILSEGEDVPEGALNEVLSIFEEAGVIRTQGVLGREAIKRHGPKVVTWVEPERDRWHARTSLRLHW